MWILFSREVTMHRTLVCFYFLLLLLLPCKSLCQRQSYTAITDDNEDDQDKMVVNILSRFGIMSANVPQEQHLERRLARITRPGSSTATRAMQGSRFALSLDVPTTILSVLIDLAKKQDMRAKAAANADLMARIGKRK